MGRTIHYTITKPTNFTEKDYRKAYDISQKYNSGAFEKVWTCENFFWDGYDYFPNWEGKAIKGKGSDAGWKIVNKRYAEIKKEDKSHHIDIVKKLYKEGFILFHNDPNNNEGCGFVKVQGNEYNSLLVYSALIEISKAIPSAKIKVSDEGEFLLCDVTLKDGLAIPDLENLKEEVRRWASEIAFSKVSIKKQLKLKGVDDLLKKELGIESSYGDCAVIYLNQKIAKASEVYERIKRATLNFPFPLYFYNIMNYEKGFNPMLFTRQVDISKFKDYKMSAGTLMDGFEGEGFGLTDKNSELTSYEYIAKLQKMLGAAGIDKNQLSILGCQF